MIVAHVINKLPAYTEPKGSLPCLSGPAIGLPPEPDKSSPQLPNQFLQLPFSIILASVSMCSKWSLPFKVSD